MDTRTELNHGATYYLNHLPSPATQRATNILLGSGGASQGSVETESLQAATVALLVVPNILFMFHFHIQQLNLKLQQPAMHMEMLDVAIITLFP